MLDKVGLILAGAGLMAMSLSWPFEDAPPETSVPVQQPAVASQVPESPEPIEPESPTPSPDLEPEPSQDPEPERSSSPSPEPPPPVATAEPSAPPQSDGSTSDADQLGEAAELGNVTIEEGWRVARAEDGTFTLKNLTLTDSRPTKVRQELAFTIYDGTNVLAEGSCWVSASSRVEKPARRCSSADPWSKGATEVSFMLFSVD